MKCNFFKIGMMALLAAATVSLTSCKDNEVEEGAYDEQAAAIASQFVNYTVAPTYTNLATAAQTLVDNLETLKSNKTDANVATACTTFLEARAWWEKSEAFLFGAATDWGIDPHIDSWPLDEDAFNALMNSPLMIASLAAEDGDVVAGEMLSNALLGFHGIEYILFSDGQPKSASAITDDEMTYVVAVAGDLRNRCFQLEVSWLGDNAPASHKELVEDELELNTTVGGGAYYYGENLTNAGKAGSTYSSRITGLMAIVDGAKTIADEVGTSKIGKPHYGEDVNYIESPYSQKSKVDFYDNIVSIQNAYMGGIEGQRDESKSIHTFVKAQNADLDARVIAAIDNALSKIDAAAAPFVAHYSDDSWGEASEACAAVDEILSEVNQLLRSL